MSASAAVALAPVLADPAVAKLLELKFGVHQTPEEEKPQKYQWTRADVLGLARPGCTNCHGRGWFSATPGYACHCVTRSIFRQLMAEWHKVKDAEHLAQFRVEQIGQRGGKTCRRGTWSMKRPEFVADLELLVKRVLAPSDFRVWRLWHCYGADHHTMQRITGMNKGEVFHTVYRIETKVGREARQLKPYALFPVADYYGL
jgi:hypothetical protein